MREPGKEAGEKRPLPQTKVPAPAGEAGPGIRRISWAAPGGHGDVMKNEYTVNPAGADEGEQGATAAPSEGGGNVVMHGQISRRAHELWEQEGKPEGAAERHWHEARRQIEGTPPGEQNRAARRGGG